jgi:hypothetical protein
MPGRVRGCIDGPTDSAAAAAFMVCAPITYCPAGLRRSVSRGAGRPCPLAARIEEFRSGRPDLFPRRYGSVPGMLAVRLLVVSVRTMSVNETVIGGTHSGWNVAVTLIV